MIVQLETWEYEYASTIGIGMVQTTKNIKTYQMLELI